MNLVDDSEEMEARTPRGLAVLKHAISDGGKVLDFSQEDDGTILIADITNHVEQLEQRVNGDE